MLENLIMNKQICIVDYGIGNLLSIQRAIEKLGFQAVVTNDANFILNSTHIILPGVGAFGNAMQNINKFNLIESINDYVDKGNSLLGICLGMQLLMDSSEEFGNHKGLGLISGNVKKISENKDIRLPNVSFYKLDYKKEQNKIQFDNDWFYFVHSYKCIPKDVNHISSIINYENNEIVASLKKDNIQACQFHPEKSHKAGIDYYKKFINE